MGSGKGSQGWNKFQSIELSRCKVLANLITAVRKLSFKDVLSLIEKALVSMAQYLHRAESERGGTVFSEVGRANVSKSGNVRVSTTLQSPLLRCCREPCNAS